MPKKHTIQDWAGFVRLPNLCIIALAQYLIYSGIIVQYSYELNIAPPTPNLLLILILNSVCIAAAGYIINDYFDYKIDCINKPNKVYIHRIITPQQTYILYASLNALAMLTTLLFITSPTLISIQVLTPVVLWLYARYCKRQTWIGNIIVAILCGLVAYQIAIAYKYIWRIDEYAAYYQVMIIKICVLMSMATWLRELVKDIEDMRGDAAAGCATVPLVHGERFAKGVAMGLGAVCAAACGWESWQHWQMGGHEVALYLGWALCVPMLFIIKVISQADTPYKWHQVATYLKFYFLLGLGLIWIL